jgi:cell division protein FtsA
MFVGLDIGTTKVACIITELVENGELKVIGVGISPSDGLRKGAVVDIGKTVSSIKKAVEEAELMAGVDVDAVWVGIAGNHIKDINSSAVVTINKEVTQEDIDRVINTAKAVNTSTDREILHVIPQEFIVDTQRGIKNPLGMCGVRLETKIHIITGAIASAQNIMKCVEDAGLKVIDLVLEPLASGYAVLEKDEKELGVALIDIGGGTTDIAIYFDDCIRHSAVVGFGGRNVTKDIAMGLHTPVEKAEEIKKVHGCAYLPLLRGNEYLTVPGGLGGQTDREVSREVLVSIIEPRVEEILSHALKEIKRTEYAEMLGAGVVLTGGGSLMEGVKDKAESIFQMPVKLGVPTRIGGLTDVARSPVHATGIGLCMYAADSYSGDKKGKKTSGADGGYRRAIDKMISWAKEFF